MAKTRKVMFFKPREKKEASNSLWYQQEIEEELEDNKEILKVFWTDILRKNKSANIDEFQYFIQNDLFKDDSAGKARVSQLFEKALKRQIDFEEFYIEIQKFGTKYIRCMNNAEGLVSLKPREGQDYTHEIDEQDQKNIQEYMQAKRISASVTLRADNGELITPDFKENSSSSIFAMQSIGKVFTGILVLILIRKGILSEKDLNKPIQLNIKILKKLPSAIQERLKKATLHQCMTHYAGFGDYLDKYKAEISKGKILEMKSIEAFLPYIDENISSLGKDRYSNDGILMVGLAIKHAYEQYYGIPCDYNEDILKPFIINKIGMESFSTHKPDNAKTNSSDLIAPHVVGSPAGGYWSTTEDLARFGKWLYEQCQADPGLKVLIKKYGQEFYNHETETISHNGRTPSSSACFSVSLKTGSVVAILSDQPDGAFDLNTRIQKNILSDASLAITDKQMAKVLGKIN